PTRGRLRTGSSQRSSTYLLSLLLGRFDTNYAWRFQTLTTVVTIATILCGWAAGLVTEHVKEQVADSRSVLLPHFRFPHVSVGSAILLGVVLVLAAFVKWRVQPVWWDTPYVSYVGLVSLLLVTAAATAWLAQLQ